jgi:hypothetical protein
VDEDTFEEGIAEMIVAGTGHRPDKFGAEMDGSKATQKQKEEVF